MRGLLRRVVCFLRRDRLEAELREEMEFHRSLLAHRSPAEGGAGDRTFGNATLAREDARALWLAPWIESVWQDVSYAVRVLWREPAFSLLAIGALTAGIGLNCSLFTVYSALAMKPWAVREPDRVVRLIFAYWVRTRTQEIGVRMALGAQSSDVIRLILGTTAQAVGVGILAGLAASIPAAGLLRSFLFGLSGVDPLTYLAVSAILAVASLLAAFLPARRATRIDPLVALRYE